MNIIRGRALHYVLKIGDRGKNVNFFKNILGMKILRHEEFKHGCEAQCNGPYENRWSKTMVGYGPEDSHFVIELTYNYGVKTYELGNDFGGVTIQSNEILKRAEDNQYPIDEENEQKVLISPDGYKFFIIDEPTVEDRDPIKKVTLQCTDLANSIYYWSNILEMIVGSKTDNNAVLFYKENEANLEINKCDTPLNRAQAYGRIAFAVPLNTQPLINEKIIKEGLPILTPLTTLDTPGKATVRVIILADPDGHEICFVDHEGFTQLSQFVPDSDLAIEKFISKDPFQDVE